MLCAGGNKYDNCATVPVEVMTVRARYEAMRDALNATGRPILYCMCEWGVSNPWLYAQQVLPTRRTQSHAFFERLRHQTFASCSQVGNSWRTTQDISASITASWAGILENLDGNTGLSRFARAGAWNDADMLEVAPERLCFCLILHPDCSPADNVAVCATAGRARRCPPHQQ